MAKVIKQGTGSADFKLEALTESEITGLRQAISQAINVTTFIDESTGYLCALYSDGAIEILASDGSELLNGPAGVYDPRIATTRNTVAWRWTEDKVLEEVAAHVARRSYNFDTGRMEYLFEESRTNELIANRDLSDPAWSELGTGASTQDATGLDGAANTAWTLSDTSTGDSYRRFQNITVSDDSNTHSVRAYLEKNSGDEANGFPVFRVQLVGGSTTLTHSVNLDTRDGSDATLDSDGGHTVRDAGDWWEIEVQITNNSTGNTTIRPLIYPGFTETLGGSVTANATGTVVYDFGQVELNASSASSPIETGAAAVTRAADDALIDGQPFADMWNNGGTFVVEKATSTTDSSERILSLSDGTTSNRIEFIYRNSIEHQIYIETGGASQAVISGGSYSVNVTDRAAVALADNDVSFHLNGSLVGSDSSVTLPSVDRLNISSIFGGGQDGNLHIAHLWYFPKRLPNYLLEGLSKLRTTETPRFSIPVVKDGEMFVGGDASFTGQINSINGHDFQYDEEIVELGGDFDAGEEIKCVRIGNQVTITGIGVLGHSLGAFIQSTDGVIPAKFRPPDSAVSNTYLAHWYPSPDDKVGVLIVDVTITGRLRTNYIDSDGLENDRTSTSSVPSLTYNV